MKTLTHDHRRPNADDGGVGSGDPANRHEAVKILHTPDRATTMGQQQSFPAAGSKWHDTFSARALQSFMASVLTLSVGMAAMTASSPSFAGDGYDVLFDNDGHVFTVFHKGVVDEAMLDCHMRNGDPCGDGTAWPLNPSEAEIASGKRGFNGGARASGFVDVQNKKLWFAVGKEGGELKADYPNDTGETFVDPSYSDPVGDSTPSALNTFLKAEYGMACIDISDVAAPVPCSDGSYYKISIVDFGNDADNGAYNGLDTPYNGGPFQVDIDGKIYFLEPPTGKLICFDTTTKATCTGATNGAMLEFNTGAGKGAFAGGVLLNDDVEPNVISGLTHNPESVFDRS